MDLAVVDACWRLVAFNDREPLARLIEEGNTALLDDSEVAKLLARVVRGEPIRSKGRPPTCRHGFKEESMAMMFYYYRALGIPVNSQSREGLRDCADIVASEFHCSRETALNAWKRYRDKPSGRFKLFEHLAKEELRQYPQETAEEIKKLRSPNFGGKKT